LRHSWRSSPGWQFYSGYRISHFALGDGNAKTRSIANRQSTIRNPSRRFALIGVLCAIGIAPILANMLPDLQAEGDFFTSGGGFADLFSADLAGLRIATQLHPVFGGLIRSVANNSAPRPDGSHFPVNKGQQIYAGYSALALAAVGLWSGRRRTGDLVLGAGCPPLLLLTLGPSLRVGGYDLHVLLPFGLIAQLPFFKGNRYPSRYSIMVLLSLAPLVALGGLRLADSVERKGSRRRSDDHVLRTPIAQHALRLLSLLPAFLILLLILFEHLSIPFLSPICAYRPCTTGWRLRQGISPCSNCHPAGGTALEWPASKTSSLCSNSGTRPAMASGCSRQHLT